MGNKARCPLCGGVLKDKVVRLALWVGDSLVVIEDVPAEVCSSCGEEAYTPETSERIDRVIKKGQKPRRELAVPVYSLAA